MPRRVLHLAIAVLGALMSVHLSGCSLIGFGVGALVDSGRPQRLRQAAPTRLYTLTEGSRLTLVLSDSTRVSGRLGRARSPSHHGRVVPVEQLRTGRDKGDLDASWQVGVETTDGWQWVDYDRIARVEFVAPKLGKLVGLAAGLTIDGIVVAAALGHESGTLFGGGCE